VRPARQGRDLKGCLWRRAAAKNAVSDPIAPNYAGKIISCPNPFSSPMPVLMSNLAEALHHNELGGTEGLSFLDTSDIENGGRFPETILDAILGARVFVIFANQDYFRRRSCLRELLTAFSPYNALLHNIFRFGEDIS
jgi:hypothetical protein